jgi:hypothetical protein
MTINNTPNLICRVTDTHTHILTHIKSIFRDKLSLLWSLLTGGLAAMFKNWEYDVLSCVQTLSGLYLVKPIDMDKSFQPSPQLTSYMDKIRKFEKEMLEKRQLAISTIFS